MRLRVASADAVTPAAKNRTHSLQFPVRLSMSSPSW